ncbi:hypothetical protein AMELA_G00000730 [Ameiurus melas]|uniref:Immunoglobulin domain-containing protein n=1 Tax=Ameiurus melas TaxID=219545 RepID=A0A7J6BEM4_AMEME|nr:hypothetical protein AMELA_G00000730 [Ameiurus melas]
MKVSCRTKKICALRESSVTLTCSYSNITIITGFWFRLKDKDKWRKEEHPEDLALDSDYAGRVSYTEMTNFSSTLTITDLRERDSGEYDFLSSALHSSPVLLNVQDSASDTYTTLNAATMSSDYDTLRGVAPRLSEEKYSRTGE